MLRPDVEALLSSLAAGGAPGVETLSPEQARAALSEGVRAGDLPAAEIAVAQPLTIPTRSGAIDGLLLDARAARDAGPVVVWYHGGGFVTGDLETHRGFAVETARLLDLPVVLVGYRLAPEAPYPAAVEDAEDAARWVASRPAALGREADALVLGGDSAGGTLAIVTTMALRAAPAEVPVQAHTVVYPATDLTRSYPSEKQFASGRVLTGAGLRWYFSHYAAEPHDWRASPLLGDVRGLPPAVVLTAEEDPVRDEGRAYAAALVAAGVPTAFFEAAGHVHGFVLMRGAVPSTTADLAKAYAALSHVLHAERSAGTAAAGGTTSPSGKGGHVTAACG